MSDPIADIESAIAVNSDQLNADDLIGGPVSARIVRVKTTRKRKKGDQPVSIWLDGVERPWKPCTTMSRVVVEVWGKDPNKWIGQAVTLYRDPTVTFGRDAVGGIRLSHMTGITKTRRFMITVSRGQKKPHDVKPLDLAPPTLAQVLDSHGHTIEALDAIRVAAGRCPVADLTEDQQRQLAARYLDRGKLERDLGVVS